jgi:thiamine pyrophosphate-dependent acetolactate synthase large subunit-like protein
VTGAQLSIRCLERGGSRYVFGVPDGETLDLNDALLDWTIRLVPVRHLVDCPVDYAANDRLAAL